MIDFGCLIIPVDLVNAISSSDEQQGWLAGAHGDAESVFIVTSAQIGENRRVSPAARRLKEHRFFNDSFGTKSDQLLRWFRVAVGFHSEFRMMKRHPVAAFRAALGISDSEGNPENICCVELTKDTPEVKGWWLSYEGDSVSLFPITTTVLFKAQPYERLNDVLTQQLQQRVVGIVGLGSGGSEIVANLACMGLGQAIFIDDDRIQPPNYIRHTATRTDLGRTKVGAVASGLKDRDLYIDVEKHFTDVFYQADKFREIIKEKRPDLLVCATDSRESRRFVNYCAIRLGIPTVIAGLFEDGAIGEVMLVSPHRTACYECVRLELSASLAPPDAEGRPRIPYGDGEEHGTSHSAATRSDITFVAALATRVALQVLAPATYAELPTSYIAWGRETSVYATPFQFDLPLSVNYVRISRRADCPVCSVMAQATPELAAQVADLLAKTDDFSE